MKLLNTIAEGKLYFVQGVHTTSPITTIERILDDSARQKVGHIIDHPALEKFVKELEKERDDLLAANKRLKKTPISLETRWSVYIRIGDTVTVNLLPVKALDLTPDEQSG